MFIFLLLSILAFIKGTLIIAKDFNILSFFITFAYYSIGLALMSVYKSKYISDSFKEELNDLWKGIHKK